MDRKRQTELRHHRGQAGEGAVVGRRFEVGVFDTRRVHHLLPAQAEGVGEVCLEPDRPRRGHAFELFGCGARAQQSPEPEIDPRLAAREGGLRFEHAGAVDSRHRVRHVEHGCHPARRRGLGEGSEVFFFRESRVAAVDMHVDAARQDIHAAGVDLVAPGGQACFDSRDHSVGDMHVHLPRPIRRVDRASFDEELSQVRDLECETAASKRCAPRGCSPLPLLRGRERRPVESHRDRRRGAPALSAASRRRS